MGIGCSSCNFKPRSNKVSDTRSRSEASLQELQGDTFVDKVVKVPVDYNHSKSQNKKDNSRSLRSVGSFRKSLIRKTTSLHSSVSVRIDPELEKIKREFETYKREKQAEIIDMQLQVDRVSNENKRLRGELKMLSATVAKLKDEREKAKQGEKVALERSGAFEIERDKVQRQFKLFREAKENELQTLLRDKRILEGKLQRYSSCDDSDTKLQEFLGEGGEIMGNPVWSSAIENDPVVDYSGHGLRGLEYGTTGLNPQEPYTDIKRGDWDSAVQNLVKSLSASIMSVPENNVFRVYISATTDLKEMAISLVEEQCKEISIQCEFDGRFLLLIYLPEEEHYDEKDFSEAVMVRLEHVSACDIFVAFIGEKLGRYTVEEIQEGISRKPGLKHTILFLSDKSASYAAKLTQDLKSGPRLKTIQLTSDNSTVDAARMAAGHIQNIVQQFMVEQSGHNVANKMFPTDFEEWCVGCGWDIFSDFEQSLSLKFLAREDVEAYGHEKYFEQLAEHISVDGPSQPLLVTGEAGAGKSMLLARWVLAQQMSLQAPCLLYHFVGKESSFSADFIQIMRRLTVQLMQQSPSTCDPVKLEDEFPKWLDKVAAGQSNGVIIVLDGVDNLQASANSMKWLLDPLPVGVHVIISARQDRLRKEWRSWPTVTIESLNEEESKQLFLSEWSNPDIVMNPELLNSMLEITPKNALSNPSFLSILTNELSRCSSYQELNEALVTYLEAKNLTELFTIIISKMEHKFGALTEKVFSLLALSRNGLSESEIHVLCNPGWLRWTKFLKDLGTRRLACVRGGLLTFTYDEVQASVERHFGLASDHQKRTKLRLSMVDIFSRKLIPGQVPYRVADELPWLLSQMDMKEELHQCISVTCIFVRLYRKGRCSELVNYWKQLDMDVAGMANSYMEFIKMMEKDPVHSSKTPILYDTLGKFLRELGLLTLAIKPLERALEIRESSLDPDDPSIGQSFHNLAGLYSQWKKFRTAEIMYKQALELKENAYGPNHPSVAKELEAMAVLYLMQDKPDMAEPLRQRATVIHQQFYHEQSSRATTKTLQKCAEQLQDIASSNMSPEIGKCLNDLGVLFFIQNNNELAESFFKRALEMREELLGNDHPDVAQSLHNLAALYNDGKLYEQCGYVKRSPIMIMAFLRHHTPVCFALCSDLNSSAERGAFFSESHEQAEKLYEEALMIRLKHFAPENPSLQSTLKHLAGLYRRQGKLNEAEKLYTQLLELREQTLGPNHFSVATTLNNLAVLLCQLGRQKEALPHYERALHIYEEFLGSSHPRVSDILRNVAKVCYDLGDLQEAARIYKQALDTSKTSLHMPSKTIASKYSSREEISRRRDSSSRHSSISSMLKSSRK